MHVQPASGISEEPIHYFAVFQKSNLVISGTFGRCIPQTLIAGCPGHFRGHLFSVHQHVKVCCETRTQEVCVAGCYILINLSRIVLGRKTTISQFLWAGYWAGDLIFLFELIFESYFEVGQWSCLFHVANCTRNSTRCISVILQKLACSTAN